MPHLRDCLRSTLVSLLGATACSTAWTVQTTYSRDIDATLAVTSQPRAQVLIDERKIGSTPLEIRRRYAEEIAVETRKVSYFRSDPRLATLIAIASLGLTVPFNLIPTDVETRDRPLGTYEGDRVRVELQAEGREPWIEELRFGGRDRIDVAVQLPPYAAAAPIERIDDEK